MPSDSVSAEGDRALLAELCRQPHETEWLEFKENQERPDDIGEYISALSNSAVLAGRAHAYVVWGMRDHDHMVVGTSFSPRKRSKSGMKISSRGLRDFSTHRCSSDLGRFLSVGT
jgi:predicted HTH transcriptional regulator